MDALLPSYQKYHLTGFARALVIHLSKVLLFNTVPLLQGLRLVSLSYRRIM